jgi:hypothetical protein
MGTTMAISANFVMAMAHKQILVFYQYYGEHCPLFVAYLKRFRSWLYSHP